MAVHGLRGANVTRIVARAGVARGMVNLHFGSKDRLLLEAIEQQSALYLAHIAAAVERAGSEPADQLRSLIETDLGEGLLNERSTAIWFAYRGEAAADPRLLPFVESRDPQLHARIAGILRAASRRVRAGDERAADLARGLMLLLEGAWTDYHLHARQFDREAVRRICTDFALRALEEIAEP